MISQYIERCNAIIAWSASKACPEGFSPAVAKGILAWLTHGRKPTERQRQAIDNIIVGFGISKQKLTKYGKTLINNQTAVLGKADGAEYKAGDF